MSILSQHRRGFLGSALAGVLATLPGRAVLAQRETDERWLRGLNGKHRQFFDVGALNDGAPLRRVHNFLATYASAYGLAESDVNALFGAHGQAVGFVLDHDAWRLFGLGAIYGVMDRRTGKPVVRNPFIEHDVGLALPPEAGVIRLQERGVRFLACNNTLGALASRIAGSDDTAPILRGLTERILPGVTIVPAMLIAGNRAQESGLTYAVT